MLMHKMLMHKTVNYRARALCRIDGITNSQNAFSFN
jgi:hypothetical protein